MSGSSLTKLPPTLLLDLDDTLVSFSAGKPDFWVQAYEAHREQLAPSLSLSAFRAAIERVAGDYWSEPSRAHAGRLDLVGARRHICRTALAQAGGLDSRVSDVGALSDAIADWFTWTKERAVSLIPGARAFLERLRAGGTRLGLVTNGSSRFQRAKLERFGLAGYFDSIVIEGELGVGKPDGRPFQRALAELRARADQAWMVGDNLEADVAGAQRVGMCGVWMCVQGCAAAHTDPPPESRTRVRPDRVIHELAELLTEAPGTAA